MIFLSILCGILLVLLTVFFIKIYLLLKSMEEIRAGMEDVLSKNTNVLLSVSSGDKHVRRLAADLNRQLRLLQKQRHQYLTGDQEIKGAMTNISHDLRTPLTAICGYLDLARREELSEPVARYLSFVENRVEAMKALTEELFQYSVTMSASGSMTLEPVDVKRVLEESIAGFYTSFMEAGITPVIDLGETHCIRRLNQAALSRVFSNILNNAVKYSQGDLEIRLTDSGELIFSNYAADMDEVQVRKLFHRFYTVESARQSTGLGLSIAKTLVEEMGGTIAASYEDGKLTIRICFSDDSASQYASLVDTLMD